MTTDPTPERPEPEPDLSTHAIIVRLTFRTPLPDRTLRAIFPARILRQTLTPDQSAIIRNCIDLLRENNKSLWMNHLAHTLPYPGRPQDWNQLLLPLPGYDEYQARMNRLLETRIAVLLNSAAAPMRPLSPSPQAGSSPPWPP